MILTQLPLELLHLIITFVGARDFVRLSATCKLLYAGRLSAPFQVLYNERIKFLEKAPLVYINRWNSFNKVISSFLLPIACCRGAVGLLRKVITPEDVSSTKMIICDDWIVTNRTRHPNIGTTLGLLNYRDPETTLLHIAAFFGQQEICDILLDLGADVNASSIKGRYTPLALAVCGDHTQLCIRLIERGADVHAESEHAGSVLKLAVAFGNLETVQLLVERGAELPYGLIYRTLSMSFMFGRLECILWLLEQPEAKILFDDDQSLVCNAIENTADVMLHFQYLATSEEERIGRLSDALSTAARWNRVNDCKILLDNGARIDGNQPKNCSPLALACRYNSVEFVKFLLARGASLFIGNERATSPLLQAVSGGSLECCRLLIQHDPSIVAWGCRSGTKNVLHRAAEQSDPSFCKILIDTGADVDVRDSDGKTPLMYAAWRGKYAEVCRYLLDMGADVQAVCNYGESVLLHAQDAKYIEVPMLLIQRGATLSEKDESNYSRAVEHLKRLRDKVSHNATGRI
ncbi:ankyrin repeat-containing domain protein [Gorgonomyces haynaldii]|nr:ankyrin repeat-containing domain protein [Gorgonomyces haynaldii]